MHTFPKYEKYKASGVDWLGVIPEHWEINRLGTRFLERRTKVSDKEYPPLSVTKQGILPQLDSAAKTNDGDNRKLVIAGDFVINSRSDRKGSSGISDRNGSVSLINIVIEPQDIDSAFCNYLLKGHNFIEEFYRMGHGIVADLWTTRYDEMKSITIGFPPISEQTAIAQFLGKKTALIDKAIKIKENQIELLKERRQILIQKAVTKGLNPDVKMKDSGIEWIGEIPEHWEVRQIRRVFTFLNTKRIPLSAEQREKIPGEYPYYGASGIIDYVNEYLFDEPLILIAEDGANLLSKSTPLAFVANGKYWVNNHAHIIKPNYKGLSYWSELLCEIDYTTYISGAAQPKLTMDRLASIKLPVPPENELNEISLFIDRLSVKFSNSISLIEKEIERLKEYKSTLINSAVTGKIKVC